MVAIASPSPAPRSSDKAYAVLFERIMTLDLAPGAALSDREICDALGVSRTPVREALIRLTAIGLVMIQPRSRTFVSRISIKRALDANLVRRELEAACAREAAASATPAAGARLADLITQQGLAAARGDAKRFYALDVAFHAAIHDMAGNAICHAVIQDMRAVIDRIRHLSLSTDPETAEIIADHTAIVTAIRCGDSARADTAMRRHIDRVTRVTAELVQRFPDYFVHDAVLTAAPPMRRASRSISPEPERAAR
jgi:DNA-binding GntR family transcriptional regulator